MMKSISELLDAELSRIQQRRDAPPKNNISGFPTGFVHIDRSIDGLQPGHIHVIAARPGAGVSTVLRSIIVNALENDIAVLFFTLGRRAADEATSILAASAFAGVSRPVDPFDLRQGTLNSELWTQKKESATKLASRALLLNETQDLAEIIADIASYRAHHPEDKVLVVMDKPEFHRNGFLETWASAGLQLESIAKATNAAFVVATSLSPKLDFQDEHSRYRPWLVYVKNYGHIVDVATVVMTIHRPDYYNEDSPDKGTISLNVVKNTNGVHGFERLAFVPDLSRVFGLVKAG